MTVEEQVRAARVASRTLALLPRARKDEALELIAEDLRRRAGEILAENAEDVARGLFVEGDHHLRLSGPFEILR